jgi:hypothetical protein
VEQCPTHPGSPAEWAVPTGHSTERAQQP